MLLYLYYFNAHAYKIMMEKVTGGAYLLKSLPQLPEVDWTMTDVASKLAPGDDS